MSSSYIYLSTELAGVLRKSDRILAAAPDICGTGPRGSTRATTRGPSAWECPRRSSTRFPGGAGKKGSSSQADKGASSLHLGSCMAAVMLVGLCPGTPLSWMTVPSETAGPSVPEGASLIDGEGASPAAGRTVHSQIWGRPEEWTGPRGVNSAGMAGTPPLLLGMSPYVPESTGCPLRLWREPVLPCQHTELTEHLELHSD